MPAGNEPRKCFLNFKVKIDQVNTTSWITLASLLNNELQGKSFHHQLYWPKWCWVFMSFLVEKQSFEDILQNRCFQKFCKFHRNTPILESLFNKVAGMLQHRCFSVKFLTPFFTEHLQWLLLLVITEIRKNCLRA